MSILKILIISSAIFCLVTADTTNVSQNNLRYLTTTTTTTTTTAPTTKPTVTCSYSVNTFIHSVTSDDYKGSVTGYPGGYRKIYTDGCPGWDWSSQTTPNTATEQNKTVYLPLQPRLSTTPLYTGLLDSTGATNANPVLDPIGVAVNGVNIMANTDALLRDAYIWEGPSMDTCGGHAGGKSDYHIHTELPQGCLYTDTAGSHSPLYGFMYDGIPIYGSLGDNGVAPTDLDECGGHVDTTYSYYHYHVTANYAFPYTVNCLKGCIFGTKTGFTSVTYDTCPMAATQYDYSSLASSKILTSKIAGTVITMK